MKKSSFILSLIFVLLVSLALIWQQTPKISVPTDEVTGTWSAKGTKDDEFAWSMKYEFAGGAYTLTTGTGYKESGTYTITSRFEDGSILVQKVWDDGNKTYEMPIVLAKDGKTFSLEGTILTKE